MDLNKQINEVLRIAGVKQLNEDIAWHGSGSHFDKFDMKFLYSGEGFIAHGWGMYFARNQNTASSYRKKVVGKTYLTYNNKTFKDGTLYHGILSRLITKGKDKTINWLNILLEDEDWKSKYENSDKIIKRIIRFVETIDIDKIKEKAQLKRGDIYKVYLPKGNMYLLENKDYEEQTSYTQDKLVQLFEDNAWDIEDANNSDDIYRYVFEQLGGTESYTEERSIARQTSELFYKYGIKGIKYYGHTDGYCYVIFNTDDVKIAESDVGSLKVKKTSKSNMDITEPAENIQELIDNPEKLRDIPNPSEALLIELVQENGCALEYIDNPSEQVQMEAIKQNWFAIQFIDNPSEQVQIEAIKQDDVAIHYIKNPSEKIQLEAVKQHGEAIRFIENPSEEAQIEAVKEDGNLIKLIKNPTENAQIEAVKNCGNAIYFIDNPSEQVQIEAIKENTYSISFIKNPSEKIQLYAVKQNGYAIQYIKNPSEKIQLYAVKKDGATIRFIENPSERIQLEAVKNVGSAIGNIKNPSEQVQLEAVKQIPFAIAWIENPTEKVQFEAIKQNMDAIHDIKNPTEAVKAYYEQNIASI